MKKKEEKLEQEANTQQMAAEALKYTKKHFKQYFASCQNQIHTCINYCARGHLYRRTINPDYTVSYQCGGFSNQLMPCGGQQFMMTVKGLQTCGDACIQEGRCVTFFKNEYADMHHMCKDIKVECMKHFCPGNLISNHMECLIECGGELCANVFEAEHEINTYLAANLKFVQKMFMMVQEDAKRPLPIAKEKK